MNVLGYTESGSIRVILDGNEATVPDDMGNRHRFQIWDEWEMGPPNPETGKRERVNTIQPYAPAPLTLDHYRTAIQANLDERAGEKGYDSGHTIATYVNSVVPQWATEATAFVAWRDSVWIYAFTEFDRVANGDRDQPTVEEFIEELPHFDWP